MLKEWAGTVCFVTPDVTQFIKLYAGEYSQCHCNGRAKGPLHGVGHAYVDLSYQMQSNIVCMQCVYHGSFLCMRHGAVCVVQCYRIMRIEAALDRLRAVRGG